MNNSSTNMYDTYLRAVHTMDKRPNFWKANGKLTSAAFKDKNGLSVSRLFDRSLDKAIEDMKSYLQGSIFGFDYELVLKIDAILVYLPKKDIYHYELHGSKKDKILNPDQALTLASEIVKYAE